MIENQDWYDEAINEIKKSNDLVVDLEDKIEKYKTLLELAKEKKQQNIIDTISRNIYYNHLWVYVSSVLEKKDLGIEKFLREEFEEPYLLFKEVQIFDFSQAYWIYFSLNDNDYMLEVPTKELQLKDLEFSAEGKLGLFSVTTYCQEMLTSSYKFEDIKKSLKENL